tara:strand:- start:1199 stop:1396 length:198 start_codon:yes stop_codon:yes gene_type:complete
MYKLQSSRKGAGRPNKYSGGTNRLSLTLPKELDDHLRNMAETNSVSVSELVTIILREKFGEKDND